MGLVGHIIYMFITEIVSPLTNHTLLLCEDQPQEKHVSQTHHLQGHQLFITKLPAALLSAMHWLLIAS